MSEKPECELIGETGNVFFIIGRVAKTLRRAGMADEAAEFMARATGAGSYDDVLAIVQEYVEVV